MTTYLFTKVNAQGAIVVIGSADLTPPEAAARARKEALANGGEASINVWEFAGQGTAKMEARFTSVEEMTNVKIAD